jgi:fatty acid desaturase
MGDQLDHPKGGQSDHPEGSLRNARTVMGGPLLNLVESNVNYHWENHIFPGVPWYHLPALHQLLGDERARIGVPTEEGYSWMFTRCGRHCGRSTD